MFPITQIIPVILQMLQQYYCKLVAYIDFLAYFILKFDDSYSRLNSQRMIQEVIKIVRIIK